MFLKKKISLLSPTDGKLVELSDVPDQIYSKKLAGEGVAIEGTSEKILSPCDGKIEYIFMSNHGFVISMGKNVQILVHIGIDTIELKGKGFKRLIAEGTTVNKGDPIIEIHREYILEKGYDLTVIVLIINPQKISDVTFKKGEIITAGKDELMSFKI